MSTEEQHGDREYCQDGVDASFVADYCPIVVNGDCKRHRIYTPGGMSRIRNVLAMQV